MHACAVWLHQHTAKKKTSAVPSEKTMSIVLHVHVVLQLPLLLLANFNSS